MSIYSASMKHRSFVWQISAVSFFLGLLLAAATVTASKVGSAGAAPNRTGFFYESSVQVDPDKKAAELQAEIQKLRADKSALEKAASNRSDVSKNLNQDLQETKLFAGLSEVVGPGVVVTLTDSKKDRLIGVDPQSYLIHDRDIRDVVNELRAAGAEAITVNGQRITVSSSIRCAGPIILINQDEMAMPFIIQAIGDPDKLLSALNIRNGVLDQIRTFGSDMAHSEKKAQLRLPAFAGSTHIRYAKPVATKSSSGSDDSK
ncbi:MAG: hypothetical protein JWL77_192 [Chthonomonadaceae bacterium]|nr:hypothetical protein [Chthonomonadaceae bacterium]